MGHLIFDTETTALLNKKLPPEHPNQARLVQLGMVLLDDAMEEIACFYSLVKPDGWAISPGAQQVHGISQEMCIKYGLPVSQVISLFTEFLFRANYSVAHNLAFDSAIMDIELTLNGSDYINWVDNSNICTMQSTTELCKLFNPKYPAKYKWPKLSEAYNFAFGRDITDAHDALADCRHTTELYRWLIQNGHIKLPIDTVSSQV